MLSLSSQAPDEDADARAYARYFSARQFPRQGRVILFALAAELYENFNPAEARELFKMGYDFIASGSDLSILARRSEALLAELTGG